MKRDYFTETPTHIVATDVVVFGFDGHRLNILLVKRKEDVFENRWCLPGNVLAAGETTDECAKKSVKDAIGLEIGGVREITAFSNLKRDSSGRIISIAYFALAKIEPVTPTTKVKNAKWFRLDRLPDMALDHAEILNEGKKALRVAMMFEPVAFDLLDESFSMTKLQKLYESIIDSKFDRRNFYRKILKLGVVERVDGMQSQWLSNIGAEEQDKTPLADATFKKGNMPSRTPYFYRFNREKYESLKQKGHGFKMEF